MTTRCPLDGSVRTVVDRDATSVTYHCGWCKTYAREVHDPIRDALQAEFEPRSDR